MTQAGAEKAFRETARGAKTDRAQLHRLLHALDEGDVLLVTRLDRLARSTRDLLNTLAFIAEFFNRIEPLRDPRCGVAVRVRPTVAEPARKQAVRLPSYAKRGPVPAIQRCR